MPLQEWAHCISLLLRYVSFSSKGSPNGYRKKDPRISYLVLFAHRSSLLCVFQRHGLHTDLLQCLNIMSVRFGSGKHVLPEHGVRDQCSKSTSITQEQKMVVKGWTVIIYRPRAVIFLLNAEASEARSAKINQTILSDYEIVTGACLCSNKQSLLP